MNLPFQISGWHYRSIDSVARVEEPKAGVVEDQRSLIKQQRRRVISRSKGNHKVLAVTAGLNILNLPRPKSSSTTLD